MFKGSFIYMALYLQSFVTYAKNIKDIFDAIQYFFRKLPFLILINDSRVILDILYKKHT